MDVIKTGKLIAELRKERGLNQSELAEQLNISNRTVSKWENGDGLPDIAILPALAETLGITVDELLAGEHRQPQEPAETPPVYFAFAVQETVRDWRKAIRVWYAMNAKRPMWLHIALEAALLLALKVLITAIPFQHYVLSEVFNGMLIVLAMLLALVLLSVLLYPYRHMKNMRAINGGVTEGTIVFSDSVTEAGARRTFTFAYEDISECRATKELYVFKIGKRVVTYLPKAAVGEQQEAFEQFIQSRCLIYSEEKTPLRQKLLGGMLILLSVLLAGSLITEAYTANDKWFYRHMDDKVNVYYTDREAFEAGVTKAQNDGELTAEQQESGIAGKSSDGIIDVDNITYVYLLPQGSVSFYYAAAAAYYDAGFLYYAGDGVPDKPSYYGYEDETLETAEAVFIEADDLYLLGKTRNGTLTNHSWFLYKQLDNGWYYYEYHYGE